MPSREPVNLGSGTTRLVCPDGRPLQSAADVATLLDVPYRQMLYALYTAPEDTRYRVFEIPKRTGGTRVISAPTGLVRQLQTDLLPMLNDVYQAPPTAFGFIPGRSVVGNAAPHVGRRWVLNVDLADYFPTVNFGRVRGLFLAPPFRLGPKAATVCAQICTHRNGLPQGAPTSPVLANLASSALDRHLTRLAREHRLTYTRYADDITLSGAHSDFPVSIARFEVINAVAWVRVGVELELAVVRSGFRINEKKVRLQGPGARKSVTGLTVNVRVNVERERIRRIRAMLHAWDKFGLEAAGAEYLAKYAKTGRKRFGVNGATVFRGVVYGELAWLKMVRGADDPLFLKLAARLIPLDPNPSRFIRQMAFGAADFEVFISHASEDKAEVARPVDEACRALGLKVFLDEAHIAWGESFTGKINTALGAARTVLCIISAASVTKDWPLAEVNTALSLEVAGEKQVLVLLVGKPDLTKLPLVRNKDFMVWTGDAKIVARRIADAVRTGRSVKAQSHRGPREPSVAIPSAVPENRTKPPGSSVPAVGGNDRSAAPSPARSLWQRLFAWSGGNRT